MLPLANILCWLSVSHILLIVRLVLYKMSFQDTSSLRHFDCYSSHRLRWEEEVTISISYYEDIRIGNRRRSHRDRQEMHWWSRRYHQSEGRWEEEHRAPTKKASFPLFSCIIYTILVLFCCIWQLPIYFNTICVCFVLQMGRFSPERRRHKRQCKGRGGRWRRHQAMAAHWRGSLRQCDVGLPLRRLQNVVSAIRHQGRRHKAHQERCGASFWRVVSSLHTRRYHQHCISVPGVGTAMLLRRRPHEPVGVAQLQRMPSIHRQPQSVADRQSDVDRRLPMSHHCRLRQQFRPSLSAVYIVTYFDMRDNKHLKSQGLFVCIWDDDYV